ncbi:hypothetical protein I6F35_02105 [Bradyrhizobium sp. BRP22]|nr:hypothetical protein [Bradyrhizobium sp. BRP22]
MFHLLDHAAPFTPADPPGIKARRRKRRRRREDVTLAPSGGD